MDALRPDDALDARPDALARLCELAQREQWSVGALDWGRVELSGIPHDLRRAAADLFTQTHHGELAAMGAAAALGERLPDARARLFCAGQVVDEARHVAWFSRLLAELDGPTAVRPALVALTEEVCAVGQPEEAVLGMHLLVEGLAQSLFNEGARLVRGLGGTPFDAFALVIGDWLVNLVGRDESRHLAFGVCWLSARLPELPRARRDALEARVERWGTMILESARDPELFTALGVDGRPIAARTVRELNERIARAGLVARIPAP